MSGLVTAVVGGTIVGGGLAYMGAKEAGGAAVDAANVSAGSQAQQLDYLKEINAMPQQYKEQALTKLAGIYGLEGGDGTTQQGLIDQAKTSPMYKELMGGLQAGENAIMRNAGATGGLRSGNTQMALADYNTQLQNSALTSTYNNQLAGLTGLAGLPTNEQQIGQTMANIGNTRAQGMVAQGQAMQQGYQNISNTLLGGIGLGIKSGII